ncbi:hypothetical protein F4703DRAFT_1928603 [Phycomyces blakesleeanus]
MNETKNILNFFTENDTYYPITFFKWMRYRYQKDKPDAHSTYLILIAQAKDSVEWKENAVLMSNQWYSHQADGTIADFWRKLPRKASVKRLTQIQNEQAMSNVKRLYKRDKTMSEILDKGLVEEVRSEVASTSSSSKKEKEDASDVPTAGDSTTSDEETLYTPSVLVNTSSSQIASTTTPKLGAAVEALVDEDTNDLLSEYSDNNDIDPLGNFISTPSTPSKRHQNKQVDRKFFQSYITIKNVSTSEPKKCMREIRACIQHATAPQ